MNDSIQKSGAMLWLFCGVMAPFFWGGCGQITDETLGANKTQTAPVGPILAMVGKNPVRFEQIGPMAAASRELRRQAELEVSQMTTPDEQIEAALELEALSAYASKILDPQDSQLVDQKKRLLVRIYLRRLGEQWGQDQVSEDELRSAHQAIVNQYLTTGESDLFKPESIEASAIVIGLFPDLHLPQSQETPLINHEQAGKLGELIAKQCGDRVADLDQFRVLARKFMLGHPTVRYLELSPVFRDLRFSHHPIPIHQAVFALGRNGDISKPFWHEGGMYILRRGITLPGHGEDPQEIRTELQEQVILKRKQKAFDELMSHLKEDYQIQTWPALLDQATSPAKPRDR